MELFEARSAGVYVCDAVAALSTKIATLPLTSCAVAVTVANGAWQVRVLQTKKLFWSPTCGAAANDGARATLARRTARPGSAARARSRWRSIMWNCSAVSAGLKALKRGEGNVVWDAVLPTSGDPETA